MKKTLILSLFLGLIAMGYLNISGTGSLVADSFSTASVDSPAVEPGQEIVSFALGNFVVYFMVVFVIYLIMRSIFKSFSR